MVRKQYNINLPFEHNLIQKKCECVNDHKMVQTIKLGTLPFKVMLKHE
jgi:hypothetical protein